MDTSRAISLGWISVAVVTFACSSPQKAAPPVQAPLQAPAPILWGDMTPVVSVKELMRDFIDPASDYVFDSIGTVITKKGRVEKMPKTDQDWDKIRIGGVMMAEGAYLLKVPRPFAPAGDENNSTGPEPEELTPAQIKAKLEADPVLWNAKIEALRNVGLQVLEIVKKEYLRKLDKRLEDLDGIRADRTRKLAMDPK